MLQSILHITVMTHERWVSAWSPIEDRKIKIKKSQKSSIHIILGKVSKKK